MGGVRVDQWCKIRVELYIRRGLTLWRGAWKYGRSVA